MAYGYGITYSHHMSEFASADAPSGADLDPNLDPEMHDLLAAMSSDGKSCHITSSQVKSSQVKPSQAKSSQVSGGAGGVAGQEDDDADEMELLRSSTLTLTLTLTSHLSPSPSPSPSLQHLTGRYPLETTWDIKSGSLPEQSQRWLWSKQKELIVIEHEKTYTEKRTTHADFIHLEDGTYTLTVYDSGADGMCCAYGDGFWSLRLVNGPYLNEFMHEFGRGDEFTWRSYLTFTLPWNSGDCTNPTLTLTFIFTLPWDSGNCTVLYLLTHPPIHPLTHSLAHSLIHSLTHLLAHSPMHVLRLEPAVSGAPAAAKTATTARAARLVATTPP